MIFDELTEEFLHDSFLKGPLMKKVNDLSKGELGTLLFLGVEKDNSIAGEIADRLDLTSGRMASVLKSLEKKGYIIRKKSSVDGRQTVVSLTDKGREFIDADTKAVFEHVRNMLLFLGEEDAKAYVRINKKIREDFNEDTRYDEN